MCAVNCAFKFCNHFSYVKCYRCALYILICFYLCIGLTRIYCIKMVYIYTTPILYPKFLKNLEALGIRLFKLNIMYVYDNWVNISIFPLELLKSSLVFRKKHLLISHCGYYCVSFILCMENMITQFPS